MNKYIKYALTSSLVLLLVVFFAFKSNDKYFEIAKNLDIFATLFKEVNTYYVDEINPNEMMQTGIDAMLKSLDPYTNYIPEDEIEDYRTMTTGQYGGIGALISNRNDKVIISLPYEGMPADKAGIRIGDEILRIDAIDIVKKNTADVSKLLKGQANTNVKLLIKRYGEDKPKEIEIKRDNIKISNVPYYGMVSNDVGYIYLSDFTTGASKEVKNAIDELKAKGAQKLILDLRNNPGGLLSEAVNVSNLFIPKDLEVVSTKGKMSDWNKVYRALNAPADTETSLVVLTNNRSASASEIVAGVIQDYDRGVLVGQRSYGKGLVQATRPLSYNSQLKITTAKYYIPSGRCIQAIDYAHKNEDGSVSKMVDSLRTAFKTKNGRTVYDGGGVDPDITTERLNYAPIATSLFVKGLMFDYALYYHSKHATIAPAKSFTLTEAEYQEFVKWLQGKDYDYKTKVEADIETLVASAKEEKYYKTMESEMKALQSKISHNKENDLLTFKDEIRELLEEEIVKHYYLERGRTEASFDDDPEVKAAIELFKDQAKYAKILKKN